MRRLIVSTMAALLFLALTGTASASAALKLEGKFKVTATIKDNDFGIPEGTKSPDVYKFECAAAACAQVDLDRGGAAHYTSTLSATDPGVWEGPEDAHTYDCPNDDVGESTGDHKIEVTRSKHHHATRIGGTTEIHISGCGATPSFINYKLKGKLKD